MVWCCGPVEAFSPEERVVNGGKTSGSTSDFPAQRRQFLPTNGNALIAGIPPTNLGHEGEDLVSGKFCFCRCNTQN